MPFDWRKLAPHLPLDVGDDRYVPRPDKGSERLADTVRRGSSHVAVYGPVGSGKSTTAAAAVKLLQDGFVTCLVPVDRIIDKRFDMAGMVYANSNHLDRLLGHIAGRAAELALKNLRLPLDAQVILSLAHEGFVDQSLAGGQGVTPTTSTPDLALLTLREIARHRPGGVVLVIDGLEKSPPDEARAAVVAILSLGPAARIVVVVPPALVTGPDAYELLTNLQPFPIRPVRVVGSNANEGLQFLRNLFMKRIGGYGQTFQHDLMGTSDEAARLSGGLPRVFLQLISGAGAYSDLAGRPVPNSADLENARRDHVQRLELLLKEGDIAALKAADGTSGVEVELQRRIRFLSHGLLLEYEEQGPDGRPRTVVHPAPLLQDLLEPRAAA